MGNSGQTAAEGDPRRAPSRALWGLATQAGWLLALIAILALLGIGLVALAISLQAQRDEARRTDLLLVIAPAVPAQTFIDHTFELYRRGYAPRLLVAGSGRKQIIAALRERGLPAEVLMDAESDSVRPQLVAAVQLDAGEEASALVVAQPEDLLLTMKLARDQGLRSYGSPPPGRSLDPLALLQASADYWRYVLIQR